MSLDIFFNSVRSVNLTQLELDIKTNSIPTQEQKSLYALVLTNFRRFNGELAKDFKGLNSLTDERREIYLSYLTNCTIIVVALDEFIQKHHGTVFYDYCQL